ncbi:MAG TPA: hypothetical protein VNE41_06900 [Chitinophagaceae bacterium]|nr:hypothetical protein [Chitinophagaceae bacterium]
MPLPFSILGGFFILLLTGILMLGDLVDWLRNGGHHRKPAP